MKNQKRFGKLLITLLSTGVLLAALQSQEIITAEETTTAEQISTTSAEAVTTTETPARAAKEVNAQVTGTIKNHDIKYYEYYTDVDLSFSITDDEAIEAYQVLSRLEGITPAIESSHAIALAMKLMKNKNELVIVNLSGRGDKDVERDF